MSHELDLAARLLALEAGRARPLSSHQLVSIEKNALILCPVSMAGEDTTIHAIAYGRRGEKPQILSVPDPRQRDAQAELFRQLAVVIDQHCETAREHETFPQIWVSSGPAVALLDILADRLRYSKEAPALQRLGEWLTWFTRRVPHAGQQSLLAATSVLSQHWITGMAEVDEAHLGAFLAWLEPPAGRTAAAAATEAELVPMGAKTDPEFDRETLAPLVTKYHAAHRSGATSQTARIARRIHQVLAPVVTRIFDATTRAIQLLEAAERPLLPHLSQIMEREEQEFRAFIQARTLGLPLTQRDKPKPAAFELSAREDALQNVAAALAADERVTQARALLAGDLLTGTLRAVSESKIGRRREVLFELVSDQQVLRVRPRDEVESVGGRYRAVVTRTHGEGQQTIVSLRLTKGMKTPPAKGDTLAFAGGGPDWSRIWRQRKQLKTNLDRTPWTHQLNTPPAPKTTRSASADPLAAVEALR